MIASSTLPEAFTRWPSIALFALTQTELAARPNAARMPRLSSRSFCFVPVPWALMYVTSRGTRPEIAKRASNEFLKRIAIGIQAGHMPGIVEDPAAEHLGINGSAALLSMIEPFEHEHRGSFSHDETAAIHIERPARLRWLGVIGQHAHVVKSGGEQRVNRFGAAGQREVALAILIARTALRTAMVPLAQAVELLSRGPHRS